MYGDYLLIKQFLREDISYVDWIHGGGCHSSWYRLIRSVIRFVVDRNNEIKLIKNHVRGEGKGDVFFIGNTGSGVERKVRANSFSWRVNEKESRGLNVRKK